MLYHNFALATAPARDEQVVGFSFSNSTLYSSTYLLDAESQCKHSSAMLLSLWGDPPGLGLGCGWGSLLEGDRLRCIF